MLMASKRRTAMTGDGPADVALSRCVTQMQRSLDAKLDALSRSATPDTLHSCRTQTRRLRALLRTFRHAFNPAALARYENVLRHLTRDLGAARSADVEQQVIARFVAEQCVPKDDGLEQLLAIAAQNRSRAVWALKAKMSDDLWLRRLERLQRAASDPASIVESRLSMAEMTARALRRRRRRLRRRLRACKQSPRALHRLRLKIKSLRYLLECCAPYQAVVHGEMKQLRLLQDRLGELHDEWSLQRALARQRPYLRANVDICAKLRSHRKELMRSIDTHRKHLLRVWKQAPADWALARHNAKAA
jgi:CHAD domain-containing protein